MTVSILICSAGRRVGLSNAFRDAAQALGHKARIIAVDVKPALSAACALADVAYAVPRASDPDYVSALVDLCDRERVQLVVPTIDHELLPLAMAVDLFGAVGARVHISSPDFVRMARDKEITAKRLDAAGIATPRTVTPLHTNVTHAAIDLPAIVKPRGGSSSIGLRVLRTRADLAGFELPADSIVQELLDGPEYTVNVFYDAEGNFRAAIPHLRLETRGGEMSKGRTERHAALTEIARQIGKSAMGIRGAFCFQAILTTRGPVVFEINARFGGGYPLAHHAGGRFAQWLLEEVLELERTAADDWRPNITALRYDMEVFR
ncbi:MAG: ATP-grasp domain-containing protein [Candidatus Sphingomonas colombiensis]|nr:ATP-grasp domain-containing protein [Sphingomonas sp.]WEK44390.1 MAG: ATP-grasp domain-containing protein [Sphingomonas sp.]